jgi:hypothetical protein
MPIMRRYGFDIVVTIQSGQTGHEEFAHLLRSKNRDTQARKYFIADPEWIRSKRPIARRALPQRAVKYRVVGGVGQIRKDDGVFFRQRMELARERKEAYRCWLLFGYVTAHA